MDITAFDLAQRFVGIHEVEGIASNPLILGMLRLDDDWPQSDAVPWCSAFVNFIAWELRLPRSKSLAAKSWLTVGRPINLEEAVPQNDVVILTRAGGGHVAFFAGFTTDTVMLLGGNQHDAVDIAEFPRANIVGVRRLA